jgi:hypothetical protein
MNLEPEHPLSAIFGYNFQIRHLANTVSRQPWPSPSPRLIPSSAR